jgi:hypothetical protein
LQDTEEEYLYNRASLVFNYLNTGANIDISAFSTSITNKNHLVFIVSTNEVPTPKSKFAFFGFAGYSDHSGTTNISDASGNSSAMQNPSIPPSSTLTPLRCCSMTPDVLSIEEMQIASSYSNLSPLTVTEVLLSASNPATSAALRLQISSLQMQK